MKPPQQLDLVLGQVRATSCVLDLRPQVFLDGRCCEIPQEVPDALHLPSFAVVLEHTVAPVLTGPVRAEERDDLAPIHVEIDRPPPPPCSQCRYAVPATESA
jgi:hypothetical protein